MKKEKPVGLYVHIPFCVRKCAYCDFLSAPASEGIKENYVNLLCEEIEQEAACYPEYRGQTVFFGGGTPTVLRAEQLERILCKLGDCFSVNMQGKSMEPQMEKAGEAEITIECNPGTVRGEDLRKLRKMGFNRLSIGLQSAQNEELRKLGRIHSWEDFLETYQLARDAGFRNINVDIMSALPGQTPESYLDTLRKVTAVCPEHISAYSLIIEEGTLFYEQYGEAERERQKDGEDKDHLLPTEEEERRMYELTEEILGQKGYHRYEISNYALKGYECRHNITYWKRGDYLGFGLGAASLMAECRFTKSRDMGEYESLLLECGDGRKDKAPLKSRNDRRSKEWLKSKTGNLHQELQRLSAEEQMEEFMFLGLRLTRGVSVKEFQEYFHMPVECIYGEVLKRLKDQKFLVQADDRIFLTKRGIDVSNVVLAEFLLS